MGSRDVSKKHIREGRECVNDPNQRTVGPKVVYHPINNSLVVKLQISDAMVGRVLIDYGTEGNIFFFRGTAEMMGILGWVNNRMAIIQTFDEASLYTLGTINKACGENKTV